MKEFHLSDLAIQQSVFDPLQAEQGVLQHLETCERCRAIARFYGDQFSMLQSLPKPVFDFDLRAAVISKIELKKPKRWQPYYILFSLLFAAMASWLAYWIFGKWLYRNFSGFSYLLVYLFPGAFLTFLGFQLRETWRQYKQKIDALNIY